jgi:hypothetical protein
MSRLGTWIRAARAPEWTEALNLAGPRVRTASWSWVLLLAGLTAAAWVWPQVEQHEAEAAQVMADVQRLQRARHQMDLAAQARTRPARGEATVNTTATGTANTTALTPDQAVHAARMLGWLSFPWLDTLEAADEAALQAQALMLGFNLDLSAWNGQPQTRAWVRMSAAVMDDAAALRWAQALGPQAQLISRDRLGTPLNAARGVYAARAELSWPGDAP